MSVNVSQQLLADFYQWDTPDPVRYTHRIRSVYNAVTIMDAHHIYAVSNHVSILSTGFVSFV